MAEMDFGRGGGGARCALHPELAASRTCTRCGNFMCGVCGEDGTQTLCPTCRARAGVARPFPLDRGNWTVSALLETCWAAFQREWVMICVGLLVLFAASFAGQVISQIFAVIGGLVDSTAVTLVALFAGFLVSTVVQGLVILGYMRMLADVLEGQRADLARLFGQFHKAVPFLLTMLLLFAIFVPAALLIFGSALLTGIATGLFTALDLSREGLEALRPEDLAGLFASAGPALAVTLSVAGLLYLVVMCWLGLPMLLVYQELACDEAPTALGTVRRCFAYARGERLPMLGVTLLGVVLAFAGILACCVGIIPATGFFYLMLAGLHLALRNGAQVD